MIRSLRRKRFGVAISRLSRFKFTRTSMASFHGSPEVRTQEEDKTHFGYRTVPKQEKQNMVHEVFRNVAEKYVRLYT